MNSLNSLLKFSFVLRSQAEYACAKYMSVLSSSNSLAPANSDSLSNVIVENSSLFNLIISFNFLTIPYLTFRSPNDNDTGWSLPFLPCTKSASQWPKSFLFSTSGSLCGRDKTFSDVSINGFKGRYINITWILFLITINKGFYIVLSIFLIY